MAADGALHQRRELAAAQPRQAARSDAPQQPRARRPRLRRRDVLPVARLTGRRREVPLRRWCPTPAPTRRSGARWWSSARTSASSPRCAAVAWSPTPRSSGTTRAGGRASSTRTPRPTRPTSNASSRFHAALWRAGITVDVVHPEGDLSGYRLVLVPSLYLVTDAAARNIATLCGGHVVVSYFSGIVDENDEIRLGGYPGAFRELLGVRTEEFHPLLPGESVRARRRLDGHGVDRGPAPRRRRGARALRRRAGARAPGGDAARRRPRYVATRLDDGATDRLLAGVCAAAGVRPVVDGLPAGVEVVRRRGERRLRLPAQPRIRDGVGAGDRPGPPERLRRPGGARAVRRGGGARCWLGSARSASSRRSASAAACACRTSSSCSASPT